MSEKIKNSLNRSMPYLLGERHGWIYLAAVFVYVTFTLSNHLPFVIPEWDMAYKLYLCLSFGVICVGLYVLIYAVIPNFFKKYPDVLHWTPGKELRNLLCFFLAALIANGIYCLLNIPVNTHLHDYFLSIVHISFSGDFMPILLVTLIHHFYVVKFTKQESNETVQSMPMNEVCIALEVVEEHCVEEIPAETTDCGSMIDLTGVNGKKYPHEDVRYFHVVGNYTYIHYFSLGKMTYDTLVISLVKLEAMLAVHPQFEKCNRSMVVNTDKILSCQGTKKKTTIKLERWNAPIRVSRDSVDKYRKLATKNINSIKNNPNLPQKHR
jgi:hypothetical protein